MKFQSFTESLLQKSFEIFENVTCLRCKSEEKLTSNDFITFEEAIRKTVFGKSNSNT